MIPAVVAVVTFSYTDLLFISFHLERRYISRSDNQVYVEEVHPSAALGSSEYPCGSIVPEDITKKNVQEKPSNNAYDWQCNTCFYFLTK